MPAQKQNPVVFTAMSKRNFFMREHIIKFVLESGHTPLCAFMMFSYFLLDTVDRVQLIQANNDLILRSDELWVFGDISDGVAEEISLAQAHNKAIRYFSITEFPARIFEVTQEQTNKEVA